MWTAVGGQLLPRQQSSQAVVHYVPSFTQGGVVYEVTEYPDGTFSCNCPAYQYQPGECKHIIWVRLKEAA